MNSRSPEGLTPQNQQVTSKKSDEVSGFVPGISSFGPEAMALLAQKTAETSATEPYSSAATLRAMFERMEARKG